MQTVFSVAVLSLAHKGKTKLFKRFSNQIFEFVLILLRKGLSIPYVKNFYLFQ